MKSLRISFDLNWRENNPITALSIKEIRQDFHIHSSFLIPNF